MARTVNKVILIGRLGDDVKMHYFDEGNSIGRFPLATDETYTNKQTGEKVTNTDWHNVVVRNKLAEICEAYLIKGDRVYVEGRLKNRQWNAEDGSKRYTTEVHATEMTFLSNRKENTTPNTDASNQVSKTTNTEEKTADENDDLPF